ncbi:hypothetical protein [Streptomyces sp. E2N166]|uniref:hypothetical protein n=1 Tax=Streptomyces sp. E2N166 TaxID=1851909 RepID=UPI001291F74F|nr:hypothetical protein [Streptomyces sp. E2N166]
MNQATGAGRRPLVERITHWSVRNRKRAAFGWLGLVVLIIAIGAGLGSTSATWKMPRALRWLPGVSLEGSDDDPVPAPAPAAAPDAEPLPTAPLQEPAGQTAATR